LTKGTVTQTSGDLPGILRLVGDVAGDTHGLVLAVSMPRCDEKKDLLDSFGATATASF
jgi:hypothetical protein